MLFTYEISIPFCHVSSVSFLRLSIIAFISKCLPMLLGGCYNSCFKVFDDFNMCDISGLVIVDFPFTCELRFSWTLWIWDWFLDITKECCLFEQLTRLFMGCRVFYLTYSPITRIVLISALDWIVSPPHPDYILKP